jgi:hypothetical protein
MQKEIIKFIIENNLGPFNSSSIKSEEESIYKTKDGKSIHNKVISSICKNFIFEDSSKILNLFSFIDNPVELKKRQEFFKGITRNLDNSFLKDIKTPTSNWSPKYDITAVTSNEKTFLELKSLGCPVKYITSSEDVANLEGCDIIQVVDCEEFQTYLEQLNQAIFINKIEDVYLERYLEMLSGWKKNLEILNDNVSDSEMKELIISLKNLISLTNSNSEEKITMEKVESALEEINDEISEKIKNISISGSQLFEMLSKNNLSKEILEIIDKEIEKTGLAEELFNKTIPVTLDEKEVAKVMREQDSNEFVIFSEKIKRKSQELKSIPEKIKRIENIILLIDFYAGISKFIKEGYRPAEISDIFLMEDSMNIFLENAQPISFILDNGHKCSILTGANSGGKTTLLEHVIQLISLFQIGLPISGNVKMPLFSEIYYFAKNKGSISKGAFETLLTQMSKINPGKQTLILADEIESVTEPGVAGKVVCATAEYFIKKGCFLVIATHLGQEIQKNLPALARIDGIEAKGLDENYELIVSHNPILGRLAHSTPELIIEKMTKAGNNAYIHHIFSSVKK